MAKLLSEKLLRLNVGAGTNDLKEPGRLNCDLYPGPNIDVTFDATKPWPFEDNSVGQVISSHVLEHLRNPHGFFDAMWHALAPGGMVMLRLPYGPSSAGFSDITHVRYWTPGTFCFLQPGYGETIWNPQHAQWKAFFGIDGIYLRIAPQLRWLLKKPWGKLFLPWLDFIWNAYHEQIIWLRALKTEAQIQDYRAVNRSNSVPIARCMYTFEYEGRERKKDEPMQFLFFDHGSAGFAQVEPTVRGD